MHRALAWLLSWFLFFEAAEEASVLSVRSKRKRSRWSRSMLYAVQVHSVLGIELCVVRVSKIEDCLDAGS